MRRPTFPFLGIALVAGALAGSGCGSSFKLPTEQLQGRAIPSDKSYQRIATWDGLAGVADALLIPGPQLFLLFRGNPGHVYEYSTTVPTPLATNRFPGLLHPAALAANATNVFVLDQGDTAAARAPRDTCRFDLDCGPMKGQSAGDSTDIFRIIQDLSKYWYVRQYDLKGRALQGQFTDTTLAWVNGIAADNQGRIYVSGVILYCFVDVYDPRSRTLEFEFRIYRYEPGTGDRYVIGGWKRDRSFEVIEGTGVGFSQDPRGLKWSSVTGAALYFADHGNNEAQKFDLAGSSANSFKLDICDMDTTNLVQPLDIDVDEEGYAYVVDSGNQRVLRYDPTGRPHPPERACIQRIDIEPGPNGPLLQPVAVATGILDGRSYVYVVDAGRGEVSVFRRRD
jgi:DNA-binding beta-propeller fold protein YncE